MKDLWQRYIARNAGLKLISLLLAVGLWRLVALDPITEVAMKVPIEFRNLPENLEIASANYTEAQVRLSGPERLIRHLTSSDVRAIIDLTGVQLGEHTFDLPSQRVRAPQDLQVVQVIPGQLQLSFDTRMSRTVGIHPRVKGTFAAGLRVAKVLAEPPSIMISGPQQRVQAVEAATTDPIEASGVMDRATFVTEAYISDPLIQVVHPTPIRVTVIMERTGESTEHQ